MASPRDRKPISPDKIKQYKDKRNPPKPESMISNYQDAIDAVLSVLQDTAVMSAMVAAAGNKKDEEITAAISAVSTNPALDDYPKLKILIANISHFHQLALAIKESVDEKKVAEISNAALDIAKAAESAGAEAKSTLALAAEIKDILDKAGEVLKHALIVTISARSYLKADERLDLNIWLEQELLKRSILLDEIKVLNEIEPKTDPPKDLTWAKIELQIWQYEPFKNLAESKRNKLSTSEYHEALLEVLEAFWEEDPTPAQLKMISKFPYINENNIETILTNLERRHAKMKFDKIETNLTNRLLANKDRLSVSNYAKGMFNTYVESDRSNPNDLFKNAVDAIISSKPLHETNQNNIDNGSAKNANDAIEAQLKAKAKEKFRSLIAKTIFFSGVVLLLAAAITVPIPGASAGLAIAGGLCILGAHAVKLDVSKQVKGDIGSFAKKIKSQFRNWKKQNDKKVDLKKQKVINDAVIELKEKTPKNQQTVSQPEPTSPKPELKEKPKEPAIPSNTDNKLSMDDLKKKLHQECSALKIALEDIRLSKKAEKSSTNAIGMFFKSHGVKIKDLEKKITLIDDTIEWADTLDDKDLHSLHVLTESIQHAFDGHEQANLNPKVSKLISDVVTTATLINEDLDLVQTSQLAI